MDSRETRGRALAQDPRIKHIDGPLWFCPSEKSGGYLVDLERGRCGCRDHQDQRTRCKHLIAVELVRDGQAAQVVLTLPAPTKPRPMPRGDLTAEEISHLRTAMRFLRVRCGSWASLAKAIRGSGITLQTMVHRKPPSAGVAIRLARIAGVPVDDLLTGRFPPPGACPHCGRGPESPSPPA